MIPKLTREQAAIVGVYTGYMCGPFPDIHAAVERVLERPVFTHEMASKELMAVVRERIKPEFLAICAEATPL